MNVPLVTSLRTGSEAAIPGVSLGMAGRHVLSHAASHSQAMAIKGQEGWAGGEWRGKEEALPGKPSTSGYGLLTIQTRRWQSRRVTALFISLIALHTPSVGFFPEASGSLASISQREAELASAQAPRAGVSPRASGRPPRAGLFPPGMCWAAPARAAALWFQITATKASHKPLSLCAWVCCDSCKLWGCTSNRVG